MQTYPTYPLGRARRLRSSQSIRQLVSETRLSPNDFIYPIFVRHGKGDIRPIASMPGQYQWTMDVLGAEIKKIASLGIKAVMPFGIPEKKDAMGSDNTSENGIMANAIKLIKDACPELLVISDMCLCDYSDHGHCSIIDESSQKMLNEETLAYLQKASILHAKCGADVIAPSGMMDGMVKAIRHGLDESGFNGIPIMSYAVKYASSFYGPFREAAECAPKFGDRKSYQLDPANSKEAMKEASTDIAEGADMIMVKPALPYLDILKTISSSFDVPVAAYQVSGEYSMLQAAAKEGWLDLKSCALESLTCIKRAGADMILTYFSKDAAQWLN